MSSTKIVTALETNDPINCAVVGTGYMGGGIAQVLALHGHTVRLADVDGKTAQAARDRLIHEGQAHAKSGLFPESAPALLEGNLIAADSYEDAVGGAEYITEAVPEKPEIKQAALERISKTAPADAVIGSNTSSIPIHILSGFTSHPERFLGVHWMNPAPFVPGVEVISGPTTTDGVFTAAQRLVESLGKTATRATDSAGFVANRLQFALYAEAARIVEEGLATTAEVDAIVSTSFGFRLALFGPFAIGDMAGLDVYASSYEVLQREFGERFAQPELVRAAIESGNLGLKTGHGLLAVRQDEVDALKSYRENAYAQLSQLRTSIGEPPAFDYTQK